ncbi:MAG: EAL domain-containing protein [Burkholderiaceae bacterium]|nr:EAL domain-containing protein [Burkholderiaceae bacterium]
MGSADDKDEITRLRAQLREVEARLQAREHDWELLERQRRHTELLFTAAFEDSPEAIGLSRLEDGLIVDVNREWLLLTGCTREEVIGHTAVEIGHWPDQATRESALAELRATGRLRDREVIVYLKSRGKRLVRYNGVVIDVVGVSHVLMYLKDVTAERMAEESLRSGEVALAAANEQLSQQLALHELTERLAGVGYWIASADGEKIVWSKGLRMIRGVDPDSMSPITSEQARKSIHPEDLALFSEERRAMRGVPFEYRAFRADGVQVWLRSSLHRQFNSAGEPIDFGVIQDITAERRANSALQEKLDFIEKLTSRVPDVLFQYQQREDGHVSFPFINDSVRHMFHTTPEAVRHDARTLFASIEPEDMPALFASMRAAHHDGGVWQHEFRVRQPDGGTRWVRGNSVTVREADGKLASYGAVRDINESKLAQRHLQESEARFRSLTDLSSDWYWETNEQFRFTSFAGYREGKSILTQADSIGKTRWELGALNLDDEDWAVHRRVLESHQPFRDLEMQRLDADGHTYWVAVSGAPFFDERGVFRGYRGIGRDISKRKRAEDETQRLAFYDTLTGLPNRRLLMDRLAHAQVTSARSKRYGALLFIDLDNFKDLNDTLGHDVGDLLLEQVALRLVSCLREGDTAARFGGDEFVVMLEDLNESDADAASQAELVAEKILQRLNAPYELVGRQHSSSPSIGITLFSGAMLGVDELLKRADVAMYQAKAAGRNTLRFFDPQMQAAVLARAALDADLRMGLQREELLLHYQPVVDGRSRILGYEALLRWRHPRRGLVSPAEFIALAEQSGLILGIGQWVLRTACRQLVAWACEPATRELSLAVNVSARQFRQNDFVAQVQAVLEETGADPQRLKLELTESVLISDVEDAIRKMGALRERGVRFALDDFGTGYSSLSYLKRLPLDQLKIDQGFVRDVLTDPNDAAIVRTILALAQSMELQAVAEGVESEGQRRFLLDNGCTVFQGYLFGRPGPLGHTVLPA